MSRPETERPGLGLGASRRGPGPRLSPPRPFARWASLLPRAGRGSHVVFVAADHAWHAVAGQSVPMPCESFEAFCAAHRGASVHLLLSGTLTHAMVIGDDVPALVDEQLAEHARAQFVNYHGARASTWSLAVWSEAGQRGAEALHGTDLARWQQAAREARVRLQAVTPWWTVALRAAGRIAPGWGQAESAALMLLEGPLATWLLLRDGRLAAVRRRRLARACAGEAARTLIELRSCDGVPPAQVAVAGYGLAVEAEAAPLAGVTVCGLLDRPHPGVEWLFE